MSVKLFFCYAHEDEGLLNKLRRHLWPLQRQDSSTYGMTVILAPEPNGNTRSVSNEYCPNYSLAR